MKNLLKSGVFLLLLFSSCKKDSGLNDAKESNRVSNLAEVKKELMTEIIIIAKSNPEFKKAVEDECLKQVRGDYNVALDRILEIDRQSSIIPAAEKAAFASLVKQMKDFRPGKMPIIFVPVMETRDPKLKSQKSISITGESNTIAAKQIVSANPGNPNNYITMVDQENQVRPSLNTKENTGRVEVKSNFILPPDEDPGGGGPTVCNPPYYYPGYIIDNYGNLTYSECINEAFAWQHDVWVLGYEEDVSEGNTIASTDDPVANGRWEGFEEHGGMIQLTDKGAIEPWVKGKFEFRYFVHNSTGTLIKDRSFGKWSRSNFDNEAWVNLKDFIGSWNTSAWGNSTYEHWIEEDGGTSSSINQVISYVSNGVTYTTTISIPAKDRDDDLGYANIQFTDAIFFIPLANIPSNTTVYNFNYMNVQRLHY